MSERLSPFLRDLREQPKVESEAKGKEVKIVRSSTIEQLENRNKRLGGFGKAEDSKERLKLTLDMRRVKLFYQKEETIFSIINRYLVDVVGPGFTIIPDPDATDDLKAVAEREAMEILKWSKSKHIRLRQNIRIAFQDQLLYGRGFLELCYNGLHDDILLLHSINPEDTDFERDHLNNVKVNKWMEPLGYIWKRYTAKEVKLEPTQVAHFKLFGLGSLSLGISPIESLYAVLKAKMNIEESLAEAAFRRAHPWIITYVGDTEHDPLPAIIDQIHGEIENMGQKTEITLPYYVKLEPLIPKGLGELESYQDLYRKLTYEGYLMPPGIQDKEAGGQADKKSAIWEGVVLNFQECLADIVECQIIQRVCDVRRYRTLPRIKWNTLTPTRKLSRSRNIAIMLRHGGISWNLELENALRKENQLPPLSEKDVKIDRKLEVEVKTLKGRIKDLEDKESKDNPEVEEAEPTTV